MGHREALCALMLVGCGGTADVVGPGPDGPPGALTLVFSSGVQGDIEPCG